MTCFFYGLTLRFQSIRIPGQGYYPIGIPFSPKINRTIPNLNLDIIHVQSLFPMSRYGRTMARKYNIPIVMTYHTLIEDYAHYIPFFQGLTRKIIIGLSRNFANSMEHVVTPSEPMKEVLETKYKITKPISAIPTGIKIKTFHNVPTKEVRKKYMIEAHKKVLFYGGRIAKEKNLDLLIKSYQRLRKKMKNVHLIISGAGPELDHYKNMVKKLGLNNFVTFEGFLKRSEINWLFAGVDLFAFPSITDTQGIVLLESFAGYTPAVAVDKLGPSKIVIGNQAWDNTGNDHTERVTRWVSDWDTP